LRKSSGNDAPFENWQGHTFAIDPLSTFIIHDLRNPLEAICACAEMLIDLHLTPEHAKRLGRNIHKAAGRMRELLSDLVGVTQGKMAVSENCNLHEILAAVFEDAAVAADNQSVYILLDWPPGMEMTMTRARMERVFLNLITNALEAMPRGGNIRISAREAGDCALIEVEVRGPRHPSLNLRTAIRSVRHRRKEGRLGTGSGVAPHSPRARRRHVGRTCQRRSICNAPASEQSIDGGIQRNTLVRETGDFYTIRPCS
jgi:K+-sensing histidine kinase KdpD